MTESKLHVASTSSLGKIIGLIGKNKPHALLIKTRFGIHTFGVRFPIDVLILDKENKVVKLKQNIKPNRLFFWNPIFDTVIELAEGTIKNQKIHLHDTINLLVNK